MHPSDRTYRNQTVRIADLTVVSDAIENVTFENCILEGPAVVAFIGEGTVTNCVFEGDTASIFWRIPPDRERVIGAVALVNCTIVGCHFRRIGVAVLDTEFDEFIRRLGFSDA